MSDEVDDLLSQIAAKMDVYEFLDILNFTMQDLVFALREQVMEHRETFEDFV